MIEIPTIIKKGIDNHKRLVYQIISSQFDNNSDIFNLIFLKFLLHRMQKMIFEASKKSNFDIVFSDTILNVLRYVINGDNNFWLN